MRRLQCVQPTRQSVTVQAPVVVEGDGRRRSGIDRLSIQPRRTAENRWGPRRRFQFELRSKCVASLSPRLSVVLRCSPRKTQDRRHQRKRRRIVAMLRNENAGIEGDHAWRFSYVSSRSLAPRDFAEHWLQALAQCARYPQRAVRTFTAPCAASPHARAACSDHTRRHQAPSAPACGRACRAV
jgi:hypothetical protein